MEGVRVRVIVRVKVRLVVLVRVRFWVRVRVKVNVLVNYSNLTPLAIAVLFDKDQELQINKF